MARISDYEVKPTLEPTDTIPIVDNTDPQNKVTKKVDGTTISTFTEIYDNTTSGLTATTKSGALDELQSIKQNILTEGAFIDGDKTKLDKVPDDATAALAAKVDKVTDKSLILDTEIVRLSNIEDNATADQTDLEIKTAYENNADTNALTDDLLTLLTTKKVKDVTTDAVNNVLVITYTDDTTANLNINDIVTDVNVTGATLDATTNVLTLTSDDGGADVTVDLSDFVNSSELTTELDKKADLSGATFTGNVTAPTLRVKDDASDTSAHRVTVYDSGTTSYGIMLWNTDGTSGDWATTLYAPNQSDRRISFARISNDTFITHSDLTEIGYFDCDDDTFHLKNGDVILEKISAGVVMKSPNGTSYKLTVNDDGSLQTTAI